MAVTLPAVTQLTVVAPRGAVAKTCFLMEDAVGTTADMTDFIRYIDLNVLESYRKNLLADTLTRDSKEVCIQIKHCAIPC